MIEIGLINIAFTKGISAHYQAYKVTSTVIIGRGSKADLNPARSGKVERDSTVPDVIVPASYRQSVWYDQVRFGEILVYRTGSGRNE